jgi:ABC-type transport system involved in cytochrome c biogenesis permease subunit
VASRRVASPPAAALILATALLPLIARAGQPTCYPASAKAAALDKQLNLANARLIVVQDGGRYKALDSFARESFSTLSGREQLPGLKPVTSLLDWVFNTPAYQDTRLIKVREAGMRARITAGMSAERREEAADDPYFTPRELADPTVDAVLAGLEAKPLTRRAANRVRAAQAIADDLDHRVAIVPIPGGDRVTAWATPQQLIGNLTDEQLAQFGLSRTTLPPDLRGVPGLTPDQALSVILPWTALRAAWLQGDAPAVQQSLDQLAAILPTLAPPGLYPAVSQRQAEVRYYAFGKFTFAWLIYFVALVFSIWALVTRWRVPWLITFGLLLIAAALHGYGVGLRWSIIGHVPVANMFEAVVSGAFLGIVAALLVELFVRTRILLVAAGALGFLALVVGGYVLPGAELSNIPAILDHLQLRIHTVLISFSYVLIFIAAVIGAVYLLAYYMLRAPAQLLQCGTCMIAAGLVLATLGSEFWLLAMLVYVVCAFGAALLEHRLLRGRDSSALVAMLIAVFWAIALRVLFYVAPREWQMPSGLALFATGVFLLGAGIVALRRGTLWAARWQADVAEPARAAAVAPGGAWSAELATLAVSRQRPLMAGAAPGDESSVMLPYGSVDCVRAAPGAALARRPLPQWLTDMDWTHLIILNLVFVMLFVGGIIMGAMWADVSWGRPWGWDPKEVFALNTWLIYAILIHVRFVVRNRGLWTAWLSLLGCAMMGFNWFFVNFFISSIHSYA